MFIKWIIRGIYALLVTIIPAIIAYIQFFEIVTIPPIISVILVSLFVFIMIMFIYYLHDKLMKKIHFIEIVYNSSIEGIDQDRKSYDGKWERIKDKMLNNPSFDSKDIKAAENIYK